MIEKTTIIKREYMKPIIKCEIFEIEEGFAALSGPGSVTFSGQQNLANPEARPNVTNWNPWNSTNDNSNGGTFEW